jgi:molybdopterin converting factor subunit 1
MPSRILITVRCFAAVRDLFGRDQIDVELDEGASLADLRAALTAQQPNLAALPLAYAVNRAYAKEDRALQHGDEVALIPPISGGSPDADVWRLDFQREPLDARELERLRDERKKGRSS